MRPPSAFLVIILIGSVLFAACASDDADSANVEPKATATARPANTAASSNTTATSINVTSTIARGGNASARVGTAPNAKCTIVYTTPSGTRSDAAGLEPKTADAKGELSWTWVIGPSTNPGNATVRVTCDGQAATATIVIS